jgi:hypothetical protein
MIIVEGVEENRDGRESKEKGKIPRKKNTMFKDLKEKYFKESF